VLSKVGGMEAGNNQADSSASGRSGAWRDTGIAPVPVPGMV
jgi:hypothetical protein